MRNLSKEMLDRYIKKQSDYKEDAFWDIMSGPTEKDNAQIYKNEHTPNMLYPYPDVVKVEQRERKNDENYDPYIPEDERKDHQKSLKRLNTLALAAPLLVGAGDLLDTQLWHSSFKPPKEYVKNILKEEAERSGDNTILQPLSLGERFFGRSNGKALSLKDRLTGGTRTKLTDSDADIDKLLEQPGMKRRLTRYENQAGDIKAFDNRQQLKRLFGAGIGGIGGYWGGTALGNLLLGKHDAKKEEPETKRRALARSLLKFVGSLGGSVVMSRNPAFFMKSRSKELARQSGSPFGKF